MDKLTAAETQFRQMGLRDLEKCAAEAEHLITKRTEEMFELANEIRQLDYEAFQRISTAVKAELAEENAELRAKYDGIVFAIKALQKKIREEEKRHAGGRKSGGAGAGKL